MGSERPGSVRSVTTTRDRPSTARGVAARSTWAVVDQGLSSLTNFALTVLVARSVSESAFGAFAIAILVYLAVLGVVRGIVAEPFAVRFSAVDESSRRSAARCAAGAGLIAGAATGLVLLLIGAADDGDTARVFLALGICMPGLVLQDMWRFIFVAEGRPERAAANDLVWAIVQLGAVSVLVGVGDPSVGILILAWGLSANIAAVLGCIQAGAVPELRAGLPWARRHLDLGGPFALDFGAQVGSTYVALFVITAIVGLDAVAGIRGAQVLLGPVNVLYLGSRLVAVPEGARLAARGSRGVVRLSVAVALVLAAAAAVVGAVLLIIPDSFGTELLGDTWDDARGVMVPTIALMAANGVAIAAVNGLRSLAAARQGLVARIALIPVIVGGSAVGAVLGGEEGGAVGLAVASGLAAAVWWVSFLRVARGFEPGDVRPLGQAAPDPAVEWVEDATATDR